MKVMVPKHKQGWCVVWLMKLRDQPIIKSGRGLGHKGTKGCLVVWTRSYTGQKTKIFLMVFSVFNSRIEQGAHWMGTAVVCLCAVTIFLWLIEVFSPFCSMMLVP